MAEGTPSINTTLAKGKFPYAILGEQMKVHAMAGGNSTLADGSVRWHPGISNYSSANGPVWDHLLHCSEEMAFQWPTNNSYNGYGTMELEVNGVKRIGYPWALGIGNEVESKAAIYRSMGYSWPPKSIRDTAP